MRAHRLRGGKMPAADSGGIIWRTGGDRPAADPGEDKYGYVEYADTFALLVSDRTTITPLPRRSAGHGARGRPRWPSCSTTGLEGRAVLAAELGQADQSLAGSMHWRHSDAPSVGAALAASVTRDVGKRRPWPVRSCYAHCRRLWSRRNGVRCDGPESASSSPDWPCWPASDCSPCFLRYGRNRSARPAVRALERRRGLRDGSRRDRHLRARLQGEQFCWVLRR